MWTSLATWARALAAPHSLQSGDSADDELRAMARRQFRVSVAVGFILLAVAAMILVRAPPGAPAAATARHKVMPPEAPRLDTAAPSAGRAPRG
jgi:hypothetical protein